MTRKPPQPPKTLKERATSLAQRLAAVVKENDPNAEREHKAYEAQKDRETAALFRGYHQKKKKAK
jgi:hypothetical protein